ncbi:MAG: NADPH:quinone oxidoreductase family protein [Acidimicrobiales bacterium]|nr:NADPH:quinone oxidoreductase family protein [Acidimicrobiales bacterium]RZV45314.1 MAG: NADPH:quinone oxidoreductase family protein [Acidimicrobiales bacterium]
MKTLQSVEVGGPETLVLSDVDAPVAGVGEVVIDVHAASVNYPDVLIIEDLYQVKPPRPFAPGAELAGVVSSVGEGVTTTAVGDRVLAAPGHGAMAEQIVVPAEHCYGIPDDMPFDEAASFLLTYGTSHYALRNRANAQPGETLFVLGAAGGVGLAAVQLGKAMGLTVIAGCSSQEKVDLCMENAADAGIVYPRGPLDRDQQKALSADIKAAGGGGVDIVFDAVGGDFAEPSVRALNWEGRFLVIGFPAGIPSIPLNLALLKSCQIVGVFWGMFVFTQPDANNANVDELFSMYSAGQIKPHVTSRYPLSAGADAIRELAERRAKGKVVVEIR